MSTTHSPEKVKTSTLKYAFEVQPSGTQFEVILNSSDTMDSVLPILAWHSKIPAEKIGLSQGKKQLTKQDTCGSLVKSQKITIRRMP